MAISHHPHPNPTTQRVVGWLAALGLAATLVGSLGLILAAVAGLWPSLCMVPFLIGLAAPLLLLTSLHPAVTIEEDGIRLTPLVFPTSVVTWTALEAMVEHTLVKPPAPSKIARRTPQTGEMFLVQRGALPVHYRVVSLMAGYGFRPIFAISDRTHVDYTKLRHELKKHIDKAPAPSTE